MPSQIRFFAVFVGTAACVGAALSGCAGPQPLGRAIDPADEAAFVAAPATPDETPGHAFLRVRAAQTGLSFDEVQRRDQAISTTENPFNARDDQPAVSKGAVIYRHECLACHGENADGHGSTLPVQLQSMDFHRFTQRVLVTLKGGAKQKWFRTIDKGVTVQAKDAEGLPITLEMPPFGGRLAREQIWLAVTYLQSLDRDLPDAAPEAAR